MRKNQIIKSSITYALIVFAIGFVLGTVRISIIVPRIGVRWAEILEAPLMVFASFLTVRFIFSRWGPLGRVQSAIMGLVALVLMLAAEIIFTLAQGLSIYEYVASRDPISGTVYLFSLCLFATMPFFISLRRHVG